MVKVQLLVVRDPAQVEREINHVLKTIDRLNGSLIDIKYQADPGNIHRALIIYKYGG